MIHKIDDDFMQICRSILEDPDTARIPSDDLLQNGKYVGGYESDDDAYCFSVFLEREYWFQVSHNDVVDIVSGKLTEVSIRPANW